MGYKLNPNPTILALDLAFTVGVACGKLKDKPRSFYLETKSFIKYKPDYGRIGHEFGLWLHTLIEELQPDTVAIERPFMRGKATYSLFGLFWQANSIAYAHNCNRADYTVSQVKSRFAGKHTASKQDMIDEAVKRGYTKVNSDHEADALGVWHCMREDYENLLIDKRKDRRQDDSIRKKPKRWIPKQI